MPCQPPGEGEINGRDRQVTAATLDFTAGNSQNQPRWRQAPLEVRNGIGKAAPRLEQPGGKVLSQAEERNVGQKNAGRFRGDRLVVRGHEKDALAPRWVKEARMILKGRVHQDVGQAVLWAAVEAHGITQEKAHRLAPPGNRGTEGTVFSRSQLPDDVEDLV